MARRKPSMRGTPDPSFALTPAPVAALDLTGRRVAVVGGTDGIGRAIARLAASRGAQVVVVGRTFRDEGAPNLSFVRADLSSMGEAARVGRELPAELDAVVLTTGIMAAKTREVTTEGLERDLAISYLSRLVLVRALAPRLRAGARVFVMGFPGAGNLGDPDDLDGQRKYDAFAVHMNTVAGNEALVLDASRRYPSVGFFGLNPGLIKTNIRGNYLGEGSLLHRVAELLIGWFTPTAERYAERIVPLLVAPELGGRSGAIFGAKGTPILPTDGMTEDHVARLIGASDALLERALARSA